MKIFLSYPSVQRGVAERLKLALEAEHHDVFFDRDDLGAGEPFHQAIREAAAAADLLVFLVAPESVAPGSYTLAELAHFERRWPRPAGRVLPVVVAPTARAAIPAYLLAVTLLQPRGELVAETVARVAEMARPRWRGRGVAAAVAAALMLAAAGTIGWHRWDNQRGAAAQQAHAAALAGSAQRALELCRQGSPAEGFAQLGTLAATAGAPPSVPAAQQDCAMAWLRAARVTEGHTTFEQLVTPLKPVLAAALVAGASGVRAGDLHAHLGWADALIRRDGRTVAPDPQASYRRALAADAANVYAHAMWAHWLLLNAGADGAATAEALRHFEAALAGGRDNAFVRDLQLGAMVTSEKLGVEALRVLNQMRQRGEVVDPARKARIWSHLYARAYRDVEARRLTETVSPEEALATLRWLFPRDDLHPSQARLWRLVQGLLLTRAGRAAEARADLEALQRELRAERSGGPLADAVERLLAGR